MPDPISDQETPQAGLPEYRDSHRLLRDAVMSQDGNYLPPRLVTENSVVVANKSTKPALENRKGMISRQIQNCGIRKVKWAVGSVPTADSFHGILAASSAQDDGLGSIRDFSNINGAVYILDEGGNPRIATYEVEAPEANLLNKKAAP